MEGDEGVTLQGERRSHRGEAGRVITGLIWAERMEG